MSNWEKKTFQDAPIEIIDGDRGVNYPQKSDFSKTGYCLFLSTSNVTTTGFDFNSTDFISKEKDDDLRKGKLKKGDIVLTTRGTVGNVAFYNDKIPYENIRINSGMILLRADTQKIHPYYLYYFLKSNLFKKQVISQGSGSAQPQLPIVSLKNIVIPWLDFEIQQKIAAVLSSLDSKIELNNKINAELEAMAKTLYDYWFVHNDEVCKWEIVKLGDFITVNERSITKDYSQNEIEYIDIASVSVGRLESTQKYELTNAPSRARRLVKHGDTIWSTVRPNRKSYLFISNPKENLVVSTGFAVLTPKTIPSSFLYFLSTTDKFVNFLVSNAEGSAYPAVSADRFAEVEFPMPPEKELTEFEKTVSPMLAKITQNELENQTLSELRDWLLPMLMNGQVKVT
jgi:type I restriction enzyme S subunit